MTRNTFPSLACLRPRKYITGASPIPVPLSLPWLTMQQILGKRKRTTKPERPKSARNDELADAIKSSGIVAMVSCTACVNNGVECYYDREQSVKCAECVRHQRKCDGSFSLQEFRKVGDQKKSIKEKSQRKRREIAKLRKALVALEDEDNDLQEELARLDDISSRMLKREMQALGVFEQLDPEQEIAMAADHFSDWPLIPENEPVDWDQMLVLQESLGS